MAMLYPWATKEYLLWEMSIGQIIMYHNLGIEMKYPPQDAGKPTLRNKSKAEILQMREEMRRLGLIEEPGDPKDAYRAKYGDV